MKTAVKYILLFMLLSACEKALMQGDPDDDPVTTFEYLWTEVNNKYAYLDYKGVDWDSVYTAYLPKVKNAQTTVAFFRVLGDMLNELRDGHVNLISSFHVSRYNLDFNAPENYNDRVVREFYLSDNALSTGPFQHVMLRDGVAYVRYASFSNSISKEQLLFILNRYGNAKGLIFDVRNNGGGFRKNVFLLTDYLAPTRKLVFVEQFKSSAEKNAFTEASSLYAGGEEGSWKKPLIILTNRSCYSATSFFTLAMRNFDNVQILGDTTGGGLGFPNGGELPNGWVYRFSVSRTLDPQGNNYENGVPPHIYRNLDVIQSLNGIDSMIEEAIDLMK